MPQKVPYCGTLSDSPASLAISFPGTTVFFPPSGELITAADLNEVADQVAFTALTAGVVPDEIVGVLVGTETHFLTTIFGLWRAGAAITVLSVPDGQVNSAGAASRVAAITQAAG
jgi:fatty-acyl-CoA synthase